MIRLHPTNVKWTNLSVLYRVVKFSNTANSEVKPVDGEDFGTVNNILSKKSSSGSAQRKTTNQTLVDKVFANLDSVNYTKSDLKLKPSIIEQCIKDAKTVEDLLIVASQPNLSRKFSLSILSTLGDWTTEKKIKLSDFEKDPRFIRMCRALSSGGSTSGLDDLATVLGVTGEDEAAKLISSASLSQMVRIISKLSSAKKRSTPLLRSVAFNISKSEETLSVKQCADVLFAIVNLSFHDEVLLDKICSDASLSLVNSNKSSVIGSIARSIGMLRCRDVNLLESLCEWIIRNGATSRPQDVVAVLMALALVDYHPSNADTFWKSALLHLRPLELPSSSIYLDAVWSLTLLEKSTYEQVSSVLSTEFIYKLRSEDGGQLSISTTLKLLNINATAIQLLKNYKGPTLDKALGADMPLARSRDKATLINCIMDTLTNLLPGEAFLRKNVHTGAGFIIDGECKVDKTCTPLPFTDKTVENLEEIKIAIMALSYHDTCVGARFRPNGVQLWAKRLLEAQGYRVLQVLHSEFNPASKLVQRVQHLESRLKALVS